MECQLSVEDCYDFVNFMMKLQHLKERLEKLGVLNLIPVGSGVSKTIRKDAFTIDVILNYNKQTLAALQNQGQPAPDEAHQQEMFEVMVEQVRLLLEAEFCKMNLFVSSTQLYARKPNLYEVQSEGRGMFMSLVKVVNTLDQSKLNARFFIQDITQHDTFYSIKHWYVMQKTLKGDSKFQTILRVMKQWREQTGLNCLLYPEILDSVVLMCIRGKETLDECLCASIIVKVLEEMSTPDFFESVIIDPAKVETVTFNYFASKMGPEQQREICKAAKRSLKWIKKKEFGKLF